MTHCSSYNQYSPVASDDWGILSSAIWGDGKVIALSHGVRSLFQFVPGSYILVLKPPEELVYNADLFEWKFAWAFFIASIFLGCLGGIVASFAKARGWLEGQSRLQVKTPSPLSLPALKPAVSPVTFSAKPPRPANVCPSRSLSSPSLEICSTDTIIPKGWQSHTTPSGLETTCDPHSTIRSPLWG